MRFLITSLFVISLVSLVQSNFNDSKERVVLISPVLAPSKTSRARTTETAKDFPVLRLLSSSNDTVNESNHNDDAPTIYHVKKLEDQSAVDGPSK
ncbi:unnamed protein product [Colias eurytheme]|nr:unnamed protein product [Colias eurytheme]